MKGRIIGTQARFLSHFITGMLFWGLLLLFSIVVNSHASLLSNIDSLEDFLEDTSGGFKISAPEFRCGTSVAAAGDVNADGIDDLVLGAPCFSTKDANNIGAACIFYGSRLGLPNINSIQNYLS
jgi:hypothetical protein